MEKRNATVYYYKALVTELALRCGLRQEKAQQVTDAFFRIIKEALLRGEPVWVRGFGFLEVRPYAHFAWYNVHLNPSNGRVVHGYRVYYRPDRSLKRLLAFSQPDTMSTEEILNRIHQPRLPIPKGGQGKKKFWTTKRVLL